MATSKTLEELQAPITVKFKQLASQLIKIGSKGMFYMQLKMQL